MSTEIILRNYSEYQKYIIWEGSNYKTVDKDTVVAKKEHGICGFTENNDIVGVFARHHDAFFMIGKEEHKINQANFECSNIYIDKKTRQFKLINQNTLVCEIIYEPYIDPGISIYDSDPEEFDLLLFISNNILQSQEALANFIIARKN